MVNALNDSITNDNNSNITDDIRNIGSILLDFSPIELSILSNIIAIIISLELTIEEKVVVSTFLSGISNQIALIAAQEDLIQTIIDIKNDIIKKQQTMNKTDDNIVEIKKLNDKIDQLENLLKEHLKNSEKSLKI